MAIEIKILGFKEALRSVEISPPTHVISLLSGDVPRLGERHLHVRMDDVLRPSPGLIIPTMDHIKEALAFTADLNDDSRLLVHCLRGLNRSPAIAIAVWLQHGLTVPEAFARVAQQQPVLEPNRLLVNYIDSLFELNGALGRLAADHAGRRGRRG